jgi:hypothetical protein
MEKTSKTNQWAIRIQFVQLETRHSLRRPGLKPPKAGAWLVSYDPDYMNGAGEVVWSMDWRKAKTFETLKDAMEYYYQTSFVKPFRDTDGKPNRPLTSCTVHFTRKVPHDH